jgi:AraC-like DNA-binding protein
LYRQRAHVVQLSDLRNQNMTIRRVNSRDHAYVSYADGDTLLDEVQTIGHGTWKKAVAEGWVTQRFQDSFFLTYAVRGHTELLVGDEIDEVGAGDLHLVRPGETFAGLASVMHPGEYYWMLFRIGGTLSGFDVDEQRKLSAALTAGPRSARASDEVSAAFAALWKEHVHRDPWSSTAARSGLQRLLLATVRSLGANTDAISRRVKTALAWIDEHLGENISVGTVARVVGLGTRHFNGLFLKETGSTLHQHIARRRLQRAKILLLRKHETVLFIATELGFPSSQYFATAFKKQTGLTPNAYRKLRSQLRR